MQKIHIVATMKPPRIISTLSFARGLYYKIQRDHWLVAPLSVTIPTPISRNVHFSQATSTVTTTPTKKGFLSKILYKLDLFNTQKNRHKMIGLLLYEDIVNNVDYSNFFKDFKLPDTFYSWFVIMELHVWMLMIRYTAEGKPGHEIRNSIVRAMWADIDTRQSKFENANAATLKTQIKLLSQQFHAALIGYDEGIMSDDKVLAGALWRRFFQCQCNNPELVEKLVIYVRKQTYELDRIPSEEFMSKKSAIWMKYENP